MPTCDRRSFVPLAIEAFLQQDHAERELVIVDDGEPVADLIPEDPRIHYHRLDRRTVLGTKRNLACEAARGEILLHWDDDDWYPADRVSRQVAALAATGAEVCGTRTLLFHDPVTARAWCYEYPERARPWVAGSSLAFSRTFWTGHPFDAVPTGEDTRLLWRSGSRRIAAIGGPPLLVVTLHARNTTRTRTSGSRWTPVPVADVVAAMGEETADRYRAAARPSALRTASRPAPDRPAARPSPATARTAAGTPPPSSQAGIRPPAVTIAIPYHGCRRYVRRAVVSALEQTFRDTRVVVVNDADPVPPWDLLADIADPRLVRFDLACNGGRYFADAVVLGASASPYFVVQDADDWSEPTRVERLLEAVTAAGADAAVSASAVHRPGAGPAAGVVVRPRFATEPITERARHLCDHHGLFTREALLRLGGCYGGLRIGYDTLVMNLLLMTGRVIYVDDVLYHRTVRPDSLTRAPVTGFGSPARSAALAEVQRRHGLAFRAHRLHAQGALTRTELLDRVRALTDGQVEDEDRRRLRAEVVRLQQQLAAPPGDHPAAHPGTRPATATRPRTPTVADLLWSRELPWDDGWTLPRSTAVEIVEQLRRSGAREVLEAGSGASTVVLAAQAVRTGGRVVSLEHEPRYAERTTGLLRRWGLEEAAEVRLSPLVPRTCGRDRYPWYADPPEGRWDAVVVDGPPQRFGRQAALFAVADSLADRWQLLLHDAHREHERRCLQLWREHFHLQSTVHDTDDQGLAVLRPEDRPTSALPVEGLGISVLTGHRPELFRRTMEALVDHAGDLLRTSPVVVLVNGSDPVTERYARTLDFVDDVVAVPGRPAPVGPAASWAVTALLARAEVSFLLHLEDDWLACSLDDTWAARAAGILREDDAVGQVRLRHRGDRVLSRHMVTGRPIVWEEADGHARSPSAHFTFNPSLIRARQAHLLFPCSDEAEAQRRFVRGGWATVQQSPGVFRHIGDGDSLRRRLRR
ncbi:glycosyltransferase [Geodermatophilus sp. SYSU D01062]